MKITILFYVIIFFLIGLALQQVVVRKGHSTLQGHGKTVLPGNKGQAISERPRSELFPDREGVTGR